MSRINEINLDIDEFVVYPALVTQIVERIEDTNHLTDYFSLSNIFIVFYAEITGGDKEGEIVRAQHSIASSMINIEREVQENDRILITYNQFIQEYFFVDYIRINYIIILGAILFVGISIFGGLKGLKSIAALGFTCLAIFFVMIPNILAGRNIYAIIIIISIYIIISTLISVIGFNKKSISAVIGCVGGVFLSGVLIIFMNSILNLTGVVDSESLFILNLSQDISISLSTLIFAGIIIGAVGAIMDVSMSISSSLWEVKMASRDIKFGSIFKSGINIGQDILGTMLNTLILAYIGSALSLILIITFYLQTTSYLELFNREMIITELLRAIIGGFGMFFAIPLTSLICGLIYPNNSIYSNDYNEL